MKSIFAPGQSVEIVTRCHASQSPWSVCYVATVLKVTTKQVVFTGRGTNPPQRAWLESGKLVGAADYSLRPLHTYEKEVETLCADLVANDFALFGCDIGERELSAPTVANLTACDEVHLFVRHTASNTRCTLFLVLGNSPGELVCDYSNTPELERVISASAARWEINR